MKSREQLVKGMSITTWEIRKWRTDGDDDQKISKWEFDNARQAYICIPYYNSYQYASVKCRCELKGKEFEFGNSGITYKGRIKKDRMSGTWKTDKENGEFFAVLLPPKKNKKVKSLDRKERSFVLWYKKLGEWIKSGWSKAVTYIDDKISKIVTTYTNRCWNCHHPLKATKTDNKFLANIHSKWHGNEKCPIPRCNYFLCNECHKCLCDPKSPYRHMSHEAPISKRWIEK